MNRVFIWNERASAAAGPFDLEMFLRLVEEGVVTAESLVAGDGENGWTSAREHPLTGACLEFRNMPPVAKDPPPSRSTKPRSTAPKPREASASEPIRHSAYDPDYDLDLMHLNTGGRRHLRDFSVVALGLNALVVAGVIFLPFNPISATVLLSLFIAGNVGISWIFGVVMR